MGSIENYPEEETEVPEEELPEIQEVDEDPEATYRQFPQFRPKVPSVPDPDNPTAALFLSAVPEPLPPGGPPPLEI